MHQKRGDLNRDRRVARPGGWLDRVANTLCSNGEDFRESADGWKAMVEIGIDGVSVSPSVFNFHINL